MTLIFPKMKRTGLYNQTAPTKSVIVHRSNYQSSATIQHEMGCGELISIIFLLQSILGPQEIYYYAGKVRSVTHENVTSESMALRATTNPDQQSLCEITGDQGPLAAGVLPHVECGQADGDKNTWEAVAAVTTAKRKAKKQDPDPAVVVVPETIEENLGC